MAQLSIEDIKDLTDNIAFLVQATKDVVGNSAVATSLIGITKLQIDRIVDFDNADKQRFMQDSFKALQEGFTWEDLITTTIRPAIASLNINIEKNALTVNIKSVSDKWAYEVAESKYEERIAPEFAQLSRAAGMDIVPFIVFPLVTILATETITEPGVGIFTDGDAVDTTLYGGGNIEAECLTDIGDVAIVITAKGIDEYGKVNEWKGTIPNTAVEGDKFDLVAANAEKCINITEITFTGGTVDESFQIQTKLDRIVTA